MSFSLPGDICTITSLDGRILRYALKSRKAVIPVAGLGTRFLPATKAQPKEMLPLVDKPVIQYVVEEAIHAGIENIILVTGRGKQAIENHFDVAFELEDTLSRRGKTKELEQIQSITRLGQFAYVRQGEPLGLGHAVLCARIHRGQRAVRPAPGRRRVRRGRSGPGRPDRRLRGHRQVRGGRPGSAPGPRLPLRHRQPARPCPRARGGRWTGSWRSPPRTRPPAAGRWWGATCSKPECSTTCRKVKPGVGGEYQLTDALAALAAEGQLVAAPIPARRYDTGDKLDYLRPTWNSG